MIALNEILKNQRIYETKYNTMGVNHNINKVIKLEQKFIIFDDIKNKNRAMCNKLCSEVADKINEQKDISQLINQINNLDKQISKNEKMAKKAMNKINKILERLPNLPLNENISDINIKTNPNSTLTKSDFIEKIENSLNITHINSIKKLLNNHKKVVLKSENLPTLFQLNNKKSSQYLIFDIENSLSQFNALITYLSTNAINLTQKSIKTLKLDSAIEYQAILSDKSQVSIEFLGEYISRAISLKYYDKSLDMTKFVNMIRITINQ